MKEYKGSGSVHAIFEWYAKQELNASGAKPIFVKPEIVEKKRKGA
tara:strand:+ start:791 stop:925 length:135 start_codon:yes stop_codon:yes gene_type:complete